ncbi:polymer-forming cytoskeletal protein [Phycisphaeraceae bacterium D3-23]
MNTTPARPICCALLAAMLSGVGCETDPATPGGAATNPSGNGRDTTLPTTQYATRTTAAVDAFDEALARGIADNDERLALLQRRWSAVQRAVAAAGVDHEGAFYAARGYWHTGFLRSGDWSWQQSGDLDEPIVIDGRGTVLIQGNANADITVNDDAVVHILGDLNASLILRGAGEVVIAGSINPAGHLVAGGTLDLYTGGGVSGRITAQGSGVLVIDGPLIGNLTTGQPVTAMHITGDCIGQINAPDDAAALLTLRVDGYMPQASLQAALNSGFTRLTATIARSDAQPGLYPAHSDTEPAGRPTSRWVIHERAQR